MIEQCGVLEISASRLAHNIAVLRRAIGEGAILCATVKANAYGHGVREMMPLLRRAGVRWVAVYSLGEAMELAAGGVNCLALAPLVLTETQPDFENLLAILRSDIRCNITDEESARRLSGLLRNGVGTAGADVRLAVHMQVDTGLTRMGVAPAEAPALARLIAELPGLFLEGIFSHLSHGDVPGDPMVQRQLALLQKIAQPLRESSPDLLVHMQNSGGALHLGDAGLNMVRIGIALYGLQPSMAALIGDLQPIARVCAPILAIHERPAGAGVGYGHMFVTRRPSRLAIVPMGYAEGIPRGVSNRCVAQVRGLDFPVVGRISMDQIILDVTDLPGVQVGEWATVISWDPAKGNCLDRLAEATGTIGYEIATGLGGRLRRTVID